MSKNKKEFREYSWKIADDIEIYYENISYNHLHDQEMIIADSRDCEYTDITCSDTVWLTKLKKNPTVYVKRITLNQEGDVLRIEGVIPKNNFTVRKTHALVAESY